MNTMTRLIACIFITVVIPNLEINIEAIDLNIQFEINIGDLTS